MSSELIWSHPYAINFNPRIARAFLATSFAKISIFTSNFLMYFTRGVMSLFKDRWLLIFNGGIVTFDKYIDCLSACLSDHLERFFVAICEPFTCQNGGSCNPGNDPMCICLPGFTGTYCESGQYWTWMNTIRPQCPFNQRRPKKLKSRLSHNFSANNVYTVHCSVSVL